MLTQIREGAQLCEYPPRRDAINPRAGYGYTWHDSSHSEVISSLHASTRVQAEKDHLKADCMPDENSLGKLRFATCILRIVSCLTPTHQTNAKNVDIFFEILKQPGVFNIFNCTFTIHLNCPSWTSVYRIGLNGVIIVIYVFGSGISTTSQRLVKDKNTEVLRSSTSQV